MFLTLAIIKFAFSDRCWHHGSLDSIIFKGQMTKQRLDPWWESFSIGSFKIDKVSSFPPGWYIHIYINPIKRLIEIKQNLSEPRTKTSELGLQGRLLLDCHWIWRNYRAKLQKAGLVNPVPSQKRQHYDMGRISICTWHHAHFITSTWAAQFSFILNVPAFWVLIGTVFI